MQDMSLDRGIVHSDGAVPQRLEPHHLLLRRLHNQGFLYTVDLADVFGWPFLFDLHRGFIPGDCSWLCVNLHGAKRRGGQLDAVSTHALLLG